MERIPDNLIPMMYLIIALVAAIVLKMTGVSGDLPGMIIGAALTRVKMPAPKGERK